jgi:hypothetical protein
MQQFQIGSVSGQLIAATAPKAFVCVSLQRMTTAKTAKPWFKDITTILSILGVIAVAFGAGFFIRDRADSYISDKVTERFRSRVEAVEKRVQMIDTLEARIAAVDNRVSRVNQRIGNLGLTVGPDIPAKTYGCGGSSTSPDPLAFMVGQTDGTSCGTPNADVYRKLILSIPPE